MFTAINSRKLCLTLYTLYVFIAAATAFLTQQEFSTACSNHITANISRGTNGIVALILARGGSKGIPYKNLAKIDGVSLLGNTLRIIHNCRWKFDEVWVSTDDNLIAREARRFNANVHYRSEYSARDEATSIESIQEFLNGHRHIQSIALIQCTSVFIRESYLEAAVEMFSQSHDIDCVFSVQRAWKLRWQQVAGDSSKLKAINFDPKQRPRRQDWSGELVETGMFYFIRRHLIERDGLLQNERCGFIEIEPQHALEIDTPFQLKLANTLVKLIDG